MKNILIIAAILLPFMIENGLAQTLKVTVRDERNVGVPSDIFVYKTTNITDANQLVVGETNQAGIYVDNHKCESPQVIWARPKSNGAYFDSHFTPCKQDVAITVLHRKTPTGIAFNGFVSSITLPDGNAGLIATWVFLDTAKSEKMKSLPLARAACDVTVRPRLDHKVFKIDDGKLVSIATGKTKPSQVIMSFNSTDLYSAIFPSSCADAKDKILVLQNSSAARIDRQLAAGTFSTKNAVQLLNVQ